MLKKSCPWCNENIGLWQLGRRPKKAINFFTVLPNLAICPYCAKPVKISKNLTRVLFVCAPLVALGLLPVFSGFELPNWYFSLAYTVMIVIFVAIIFFGKFEKDHDL